MPKIIAFIDSEVGVEDKKIHDIGAIRSDGATFHSPSPRALREFLSGVNYICGHNIIHHDLRYLNAATEQELSIPAIDTLYLSPLLFPKRPYHALIKDDKLFTEELNNPLNDSKKAEKLFYDEVNAFQDLPHFLKQIFYFLLYPHPEFKSFFDFLEYRIWSLRSDLKTLIESNFGGKLCANADFAALIQDYPIELAYALALIWVDDASSVVPPWVRRSFPRIDNVMKLLRNTPCAPGCPYCKKTLDIHLALKRVFGYDSFRRYAGEPLQEKAVQAAVDGKSLLAVFPTGGGKSLTFQLPALMAAETMRGLTVVISPLQSLMKDQVDNLAMQGITSAVTVNGLLDPIERANALERLSNGSAHILYISPEQLRSRTIERILTSRNVVRFVIDEAHCFSAWGQDFRVDYLYIGDFIRQLQSKCAAETRIPVSCFTATAKQKVISDIRDYFKRKLDLELEIYATTATRENLRYAVIHCETPDQKYNTLRNLIAQKDCPTIVYVSRTRRTRDLADRLTRDGFPAKPFNGKMDPNEKIINQEAFIQNEVKIIVATSAFGMGVDKKDIRLVVHYDISSSLEDYIQEAGRAGRDPSIQADCYVLFSDKDLDAHFILLNQTKLSMSEIQQVWKAIKDLTKQKSTICCSPLEIARQAGWNESDSDIETRVKTAVQALETAGYLKRGRNMPHVYATGINCASAMDAAARIERSEQFSEKEKANAKRIAATLIGHGKRAKAGNDDAETRVDYLADMLGMTISDVIRAVTLMRQTGILDDSQDITASIFSTDAVNRSMQTLEQYIKLERFLFEQFEEDGGEFNVKELNEAAQDRGIADASVKKLNTILNFLSIKGYLQKVGNSNTSEIKIYLNDEIQRLKDKLERRLDICKFAVQDLFDKAAQTVADGKGEKPVVFSLVGMLRDYREAPKMETIPGEVGLDDVADALLYLSKIGALKLEGGFLVLYNGMEIKRLVTDNRIKYKVEDYRFLDEFYRQKIRMIHIIGEFANLMVSNFRQALKFVNDYFQMDYRKFIDTYFKGEKRKELDRNISPGQYSRLFDSLSEIQEQIVNDKESKYIVVAAGPGSGKTRVLVHKLAALLLMEDVKHDKLLMLTFSRAAATEFKKRLLSLIGSAANYVDIKTFHSYCFDLLGKIGRLEGADDVVEMATKMILSGEVEPGKITKSVLVIDEAQDMSEKDFALIQAIMHSNDDMRVIAVGDDDQNIYGFRGSNSKYLRMLIDEYGAKRYEMPENYRSCRAVVGLANAFVTKLHGRLKQNPGVAVSPDLGNVMITRHRCRNFIEGFVNDIEKTHRAEKACVLTQTNDEALQVLSMLEKRGIRAKLIQNLGDLFHLSDLLEIRYFLNLIQQSGDTAVISDEAWNNAKGNLLRHFAGSSCLEICENMLRDFELVYPDKFRTDLEEFIKESHYEDFYDDEQEVLYVSTIHKAKGREFDSVYMLLQNCYANDDEKRRALYVGITRAKTYLSIHCNTSVLDGYALQGVLYKNDSTEYPAPDELLIQLDYRDVYLDFFKSRQKELMALRSGMELTYRNNSLYGSMKSGTIEVVRFSKGFKNKLDRWASQGYEPVTASIRFIVAWRKDEKDTFILLPSIKLKKQAK